MREQDGAFGREAMEAGAQERAAGEDRAAHVLLGAQGARDGVLGLARRERGEILDPEGPGRTRRVLLQIEAIAARDDGGAEGRVALADQGVEGALGGGAPPGGRGGRDLHGDGRGEAADDLGEALRARRRGRRGLRRG